MRRAYEAVIPDRWCGDHSTKRRAIQRLRSSARRFRAHVATTPACRKPSLASRARTRGVSSLISAVLRRGRAARDHGLPEYSDIVDALSMLGIHACVACAQGIRNTGSVRDDLFAAVADRLDLPAAAAGLERNDLLPPRLEDTVGGELGARFTEALAQDLTAGRYDPDRAVFVPVPKQSLATRPAAILTLRDRVVYDALVAILRPRVDTSLVNAQVVFWPRGTSRVKRWREFDEAPAATDHSHVALLDIAGFYESIDHPTLTDILIASTGRRAIVEALQEFLGRVMGKPRGLPQGLSSSDPLATAYLSGLDRAMLRAGYDYFRNGDDMRIAVAAYDSGVEAVARVEQELRNLGLGLNGSKCKILRMETYRRQLDHIAAAKSDLRKRLEELRLEALVAGGEPALQEFLETHIMEPVVGLEDIDARDLLVLGDDQYQSETFEDLIESLRGLVTPDECELAASLFLATVEHAPDAADPLPKEDFHERVRDALLTLAAAGDGRAVAHCSRLLMSFPSETELIVQYLRAVAQINPAEAIAQAEAAAIGVRFMQPGQLAWLFRLFAEHPEVLGPDLLGLATQIANTEHDDWLRRVAAAQLLAAVGSLEQDLLRRLWRIVPPALQPELVQAAVLMAGKNDGWPQAFIEGCKGDRVLEVVLGHLGRVV
jgi:hypothetical protein